VRLRKENVCSLRDIFRNDANALDYLDTGKPFG
jgi:hypothetical protein